MDQAVEELNPSKTICLIVDFTVSGFFDSDWNTGITTYDCTDLIDAISNLGGGEVECINDLRYMVDYTYTEDPDHFQVKIL